MLERRTPSAIPGLKIFLWRELSVTDACAQEELGWPKQVWVFLCYILATEFPVKLLLSQQTIVKQHWKGGLGENLAFVKVISTILFFILIYVFHWVIKIFPRLRSFED